MADGVEQTKALLEKAKAETEQARQDLAEIEAQIAKIDAVELAPLRKFEKTDEVLGKLRDNIHRMDGHRIALSETYQSALNVKQGIEDLFAFEKEAAAYLKEIFYLDKGNRFEDGLRRVDELRQKTLALDYGDTLDLQTTLLEICAWTECGLISHSAEINVLRGNLPFTFAELDDFVAKVNALPLGIHTESERDAFLDKSRGYVCLMQADLQQAGPNTHALLCESLNVAGTVEAMGEKNSELTKGRLAYLKSILLASYNELCEQAFTERRDYAFAAKLFPLRERFDLSELTQKDYRFAKDEQDFKIRFYLETAPAMSRGEFETFVDGCAENLKDTEDAEFVLLSRFLAHKKLSEDQKESLLNALAKTSFQWMVCLLGEALSIGLDAGTQDAVMDRLVARKEKRLDLDASSKYLLICKEKLKDSAAKKFQSLLKDLLRSPKAHKVAVKSVVPETHALYGEDPKDFRKPLGKPMKDTIVKKWDSVDQAALVSFGIIFPTLFLCVAFAAILGVFGQKQIAPYLLIIPFLLELGLLHLLIVRRHGRDERGSAIFRRVLGLDALIKSVVGLLYFALPATFPALKPVGLTMLIVAALEGAWGFFFFKDKKRMPGALIYAVLLLCETASLVFFILSMMNGKL